MFWIFFNTQHNTSSLYRDTFALDFIVNKLLRNEMCAP